MGILGEIESMVGSGKRRLQIAQKGVDRAKLRQLHAGRAAAGDGAIVNRAGFRDSTKAPQSIGNDLGRRAQRFLRPLGNCVPGKFQLGQANEQRMAGFSGLYRGNERHLVLRAPSTLAISQFAPQVSIVDLDATIELARFFSQRHDLHQFVFQQPGGLVAHPQVALEFQRRYAVFRLTQQMHAQKPARQRQLRGLEYRPANCGGLLPAYRTLPVLQPLALESAMVRFAAIRADKSLWPARSNQRCVAFLLRSVVFDELGHRHPFLKLNLVDSHRASPLVGMRYYPAPTGSPGEPVRGKLNIVANQVQL